ncbi:unnamed protein product [Caenorhabditis brenneri]
MDDDVYWGERFFPGFSNESARFWLRVEEITDKLHTESVYLNYYIAFVGVFLNIFHLFILTKKQMMTSSTNVIMMAISICDLVTMMNLVRQFLNIKWSLMRLESKDKCWPPLNYYIILFSCILQIASTCLKRCAVWSAVLLSAVRTMVIRSPTSARSEKMCAAKFGWKSTAITFLLASIVPIGENLGTRITVQRTWTPADYCTNFPVNYTQPEYLEKSMSIYGIFNFWFIEAYVNMIIPSIILPISTIILMIELKKAEARRKRLRNSNSEDVKNSNTSKFVLAMTITFVVSIAPQGIFFVLINVLGNYQGFV